MFRSLIANLGAANNYKIDHLKTEKVQQLMKNAQYYYITGFFHTVSHDSILHVAQHAAENNKVFMANLSANFVPQFFLDRLLKTLPYVDYLFGNDDEAKALSKALGWKTEDVKEIAEKVSLMDKVNKKRDRVVIFTQGSNPVVVAINGKVNPLRFSTKHERQKNIQCHQYQKKNLSTPMVQEMLLLVDFYLNLSLENH